MIRQGLAYVTVAGLMALALRHWYWSLCGLILLTVLQQHPDMPGPIGGIAGLNLWNALFAAVCVGWWMNRADAARAAPAPRWLVALVFAYGAMIVVTSLMALPAVGGAGAGSHRLSYEKLLQDGLINPLKYLVVGILVFQGARTRDRTRWALITAVGSCLCYGLFMFKSMGARVLTMDYRDARRLTDKLIGLHANDMAEVLAFGLVAGAVLLFLLPRGWQRLAWLGAWLANVPAFVALKSRAGFAAIGACLLVLGLLRYRVLLVLLPILVAAVVALDPSVQERVLTGVGRAREENDWEAISAGRVTMLWPATLDQIWKSPLVGHGRYGILHTPAYDGIVARGMPEHEIPEHPHSAYLEILLDAGAIGLAICVALAAAILRCGYSLLRVVDDPLARAVGVVAVAGLVLELAAGLTGSSFFMKQSAVPFVCAWGAAFRVYAEQRAYAHCPAFGPLPRSRLSLFTSAGQG